MTAIAIFTFKLVIFTVTIPAIVALINISQRQITRILNRENQ